MCTNTCSQRHCTIPQFLMACLTLHPIRKKKTLGMIQEAHGHHSAAVKTALQNLAIRCLYNVNYYLGVRQCTNHDRNQLIVNEDAIKRNKKPCNAYWKLILSQWQHTGPPGCVFLTEFLAMAWGRQHQPLALFCGLHSCRLPFVLHYEYDLKRLFR